MKKIGLIALSAMFLLIQSCAQYNLDSVLGSTSESNNDSSSSSSSTISTLGNILGNIFASDKVELSQLVGTWNYSGPAIGFQSDDVLKKIGGSAASAAIEKELETYYNKLGLNNLVLTIENNANFTMKAKFITLSGVINKGENGMFIFNIKAFGSINVGTLEVYTTLSGNTLSLTCDAEKFVELAKKIMSMTNNSTLQGVISLLESYDGVTVGFKLKK